MGCLPACLGSRGPCSIAAAAKSLVRRPSGSIGLLDGIRALSVAWVVAHHALTRMEDLGKPFADPGKPFLRPLGFDSIMLAWYMAPVRIGTAAVDLFFLLSGFLIAYLLGREVRKTGCINIPRFLGRRWLRLTPVYALVILLFSTYAWRSCFTWGWTNLLFINNFVGPQMFQGVGEHGPNSEQAGCMGHSWSIAVEFQMYLASPLLVLAMHRLGRLHWLVPAVGTAASAWLRWRAWAADNDHDALELAAYNKPLTRFSPYLAGMEVAFLLGPAIDAAGARQKALQAHRGAATDQSRAVPASGGSSGAALAERGAAAEPLRSRAGLANSPTTSAAPIGAGPAEPEAEGSALPRAPDSPAPSSPSQGSAADAESPAIGASTPELGSSASRLQAPAAASASAAATPVREAAASGASPALPPRAAVPCGALAPLCYWAGVAGWLAGSFASSGPVLGALLDPMVFNAAKQADSTAVGVAFALFRPLFGALTAMALFGLVVARLDEDEDKEAAALGARQEAHHEGVPFDGEPHGAAEQRVDVSLGRQSASAESGAAAGTEAAPPGPPPLQERPVGQEPHAPPSEGGCQHRGRPTLRGVPDSAGPPSRAFALPAESRRASAAASPAAGAATAASAREIVSLLARGRAARRPSDCDSGSSVSGGADSRASELGSEPALRAPQRVRWDPLPCCPAWACGRWPASGRGLGSFLEQWWLVPLARLGYTVYLVHMPIIFGCGALLAVAHDDGEAALWAKFMVVCALTLVASMALAFVIYTLVERPCNESRERCWCLRSGPAATPSSLQLRLDPVAALARPCAFKSASAPASASKV